MIKEDVPQRGSEFRVSTPSGERGGAAGPRRGRRRLAIGALLSATLALAGCGGGSGDSDVQNPTLPEDTSVTGVFIDDAVVGLGYESGLHSSSTNGEGRFRCNGRSDEATFSIGALVLGSAACAEVVSPVELVADGHTRHPVVMAIASFLQSLDGDGDRTDGLITITPEVIDWVTRALEARGLTEFDLSTADAADIAAFTREVVALSAADDDATNDLVYTSPEDAADRLEEQLAEQGLFSYYVQEAFLGQELAQIGGGTTVPVRFVDGEGQEWAVFNVAHRLSLTPVGTTAGEVTRLELAAFIRDIELVEVDGTRYALVALGKAGIAVVDLATPTAPVLRHTVPVGHFQDGLTFAEGGGSLVTDVVIESAQAPVSTLATDGTDLWIGNADYGLHRTALSNLIAETPVTEEDGTLVVDQEVYTLQYAGEHPWGRPSDLQLHDGHLYVAQGFLGVGVYAPDTLDKVGYYNLYTDDSVTEDWFIDLDVETAAQTGFVDPETGMPTFDQASYEILQVWRGGIDAPTPWADFDRYGKYYYNARGLDVVEIDDGAGGTTTRMFVAYGLGGLVALDVDATDPADVQVDYLGYAPAVPANGPDQPRDEKSNSLFPYFGAGMLKEAGVVGVAVDPATNRAYYTDHFAGLVVLEGADDPATNWQQAGAPFDNDTIGELGDHYPDYEFVTSYDMGDYDPEDNESLPLWMYEAPSVLVTGEVSGHGNQFVLEPIVDEAAGNIDVVMANGSGGLDFIDLLDSGAAAVADRFDVPVHFPTTDEIGAAADGTATADVSIGHTQGVAVKDGYLYVADGPHGMSVWDIADDDDAPIDTPHLVANTLMEEYETDAGGTTVYPTPHAYNVVLGPDGGNAFVLSQSLGLRRVDIAGVDAGEGAVGAPLLLTPQPSDFYEHNTDSGNLLGLKRQDHAYDVDFFEDLAVVADGSNGVTVFDLSADPTLGEHVVANLGSESGKPGVGRASGVELWADRESGRIYAFVAAGHAGVGVVDMTATLLDRDPDGMQLVKLFEPIKLEEEDDGTIKVGKASSRAVDVDVAAGHVFFTYGDFAVLAYSIEDLLEPLPEGVEPDRIWGPREDFDHRPEAVGEFVLTAEEGFEEADAESLYMTPQYFPAGVTLENDEGEFTLEESKLLLYIGYGDGGVAKVDWSDPAAPALLEHADTVGEATGTALSHGRVYVADGSGGFVVFGPAAD